MREGSLAALQNETVVLLSLLILCTPWYRKNTSSGTAGATQPGDTKQRELAGELRTTL